MVIRFPQGLPLGNFIVIVCDLSSHLFLFLMDTIVMNIHMVKMWYEISINFVKIFVKSFMLLGSKELYKCIALLILAYCLFYKSVRIYL